MATSTLVEEHTAALLTGAHAFQFAAEQPGSSAAAVTSLANLEEAMRVIAQGWQLLARDAARREPGETLSTDQRRLAAVLDDIGSAFTRCARVCRDGEYVAARLAEDSADGEAARGLGVAGS
jgi:hypothetical protein